MHYSSVYLAVKAFSFSYNKFVECMILCDFVHAHRERDVISRQLHDISNSIVACGPLDGVRCNYDLTLSLSKWSSQQKTSLVEKFPFRPATSNHFCSTSNFRGTHGTLKDLLEGISTVEFKHFFT